MELIFLLALLYPIFVAALHVPMVVAFLFLKKRRLLGLRDFLVTCVLVFAAGHMLLQLVLFGPPVSSKALMLGAALGSVCGPVWWYILVKRIGAGGGPGGIDEPGVHAA